MKLETATLVLGSETPVGDGVRNATRCVIALSDGTRRAAVLKRIERPAVLAEAFSALLLRAWGLTVPEPFLVQEAADLWFGSADAAYPSLKQTFGIVGMPEGPVRDKLIEAASVVVAGLPQTPLALMADEAIDNRDRNVGNVIWDGINEAWIDHELALGLAAHLDDVNKLAVMVTMAGQHEAVKQSSVAAWMSLDRDAPRLAGSVSNCDNYADLVAKRLHGLGSKILNRFPAPKDLLIPPP